MPSNTQPNLINRDHSGFLLAITLGLLALSQGGCSRTSSLFARNHQLSPVQLFQKLSPSVFVVQALDENGKPLMLGSGVALSRDFLITNCHVVQTGSSFKVTRGKESWTARLIQATPNHDLCGLRPSGLTLQPVEVRPSSKLATGEHVYAIGSPEGLELTFSEGVISALRDTDGVHTIQTTAAISPGSSGGGLFDGQGNLVGITTLYLKEGQNLNFALPGEWIAASHDDLIRACKKSSSRPSDAELESTAWLEIGLEAVKKDDYALAIHSFQKCADLKQTDAPRAWLELGQIAKLNPPLDFKGWRQFRLLDPQSSAMADFEKAIELKPDYAEAWLELAKIHESKREYDQAISAAKEATRLAPSNWEAWQSLGGSYFAVESYDKTIDALQRGEKVAPDEATKLRLRFAEGVVYSKKGNREEVIRIYQDLKASNPIAAESFFKLYVLPQPQEHRSQKYSKVDNELLQILRSAQITDETRQAAWDTFHAATNEDDFIRRLKALPVVDEVKMKLWNLKFGSRTSATPRCIEPKIGLAQGEDGRVIFESKPCGPSTPK